MNYPAFCPKILMGIDNGHLPETVTNRCIRIDTKIATREQAKSLEPFFPWKVDQDADALQEKLAQWAKDHAMVLRDYEPKQGELINRQWEISRSLVQLAKACGIENRIRDAVHSLFSRSSAIEPLKVRMFRAILDLFNQTGTDRVTSKALAEHLVNAGIALRGNPKNPGKGLSAMLAEDSIAPRYIFIDGKSARGYWRNAFDDAFVKYLDDDDDE